MPMPAAAPPIASHDGPAASATFATGSAASAAESVLSL
jgi:hypothetical protein